MRRVIPSIHGKSHEDRAYHEGRSGGRSALARALDPTTVLGDVQGDYPGSDIPTGERTTVDMVDSDSPLHLLNPLEGSVYDEATGPLDTTRRNRGIEWAPTEYEQLQNRLQNDAVLDAVTEFFKDER